MTVRDPGLQPERTRLAWRRTALALTAVALLTVRLAVVKVGGPVGWAVAAVAMLGWVGALSVCQRRIVAMDAPRPAEADRTLPATALAILGYALLGGLLVVATAAR
jgi:uncharacterized membrane protein YidH (DUF202 family)